MPITLKNPAYGSSVSLVTNTLTHTTLGGKINQTRYPLWYFARIFNWKFNNLTRAQINDFLAFAKSTAATIITLTDEYGNARQGMLHSEIIYQQLTMTVRDPEDECSDSDLFSLEFVFEGVFEI